MVPMLTPSLERLFERDDWGYSTSSKFVEASSFSTQEIVHLILPHSSAPFRRGWGLMVIGGSSPLNFAPVEREPRNFRICLV
jgi:hypothetical protein